MRTRACQARGCRSLSDWLRTRCTCIPLPGRGGISGCSPRSEHTRSVQMQTGPPCDEGVLVGEVVHLLVERLADPMSGVAIDAEEDDGLRIFALGLQQCGHLPGVHRIDAAVSIGS